MFILEDQDAQEVNPGITSLFDTKLQLKI